MKSAAVPSFWDAYNALDERIKAQARKAFALWRDNPFHPSLRFKCVHRAEDIWSVRVTRGFRAVGILDGDTVTWFWIGDHDAYARFFA